RGPRREGVRVSPSPRRPDRDAGGLHHAGRGPLRLVRREKDGRTMIRTLRYALLAGFFGASATAWAAPTAVTMTPPDGTRVLDGQKFAIRVEGKGTGPFSAPLAIDGRPVAFTSGVQNSNDTDGITSAGWGGFNVRGYSAGHGDDDSAVHTITATFT